MTPSNSSNTDFLPPPLILTTPPNPPTKTPEPATTNPNSAYQPPNPAYHGAPEPRIPQPRTRLPPAPETRLPRPQPATTPRNKKKKTRLPHPRTRPTTPYPAYHAPNPPYHAPEPAYHAPEPAYHTPEPAYHAPEPAYNAPKHEPEYADVIQLQLRLRRRYSGSNFAASGVPAKATTPEGNLTRRPFLDGSKQNRQLLSSSSLRGVRRLCDRPHVVHAPHPPVYASKPYYHAPAPYHAPEPAYHVPEPAYHAPEPDYHAPKHYEPEYADVTPKYNYNYGVADGYSGANFAASESRDGYNTEAVRPCDLSPTAGKQIRQLRGQRRRLCSSGHLRGRGSVSRVQAHLQARFPYPSVCLSRRPRLRGCRRSVRQAPVHAPHPLVYASKSSYHAPAPYHAPEPAYHAPEPAYHAPKPAYQPPKPAYHAPDPPTTPDPAYHTPEPAYHAPGSPPTTPAKHYEPDTLTLECLPRTTNNSLSPTPTPAPTSPPLRSPATATTPRATYTVDLPDAAKQIVNYVDNGERFMSAQSPTRARLISRVHSPPTSLLPTPSLP
ncbi:extensin-like [Penaeus monodon]|uniref:extensin-like n=1 Tax=Penaeus monodon TaxID=6687 RepID=UPI0018A7DCC9|nr:extensin-like [Penaeus monodon]